MEEDGGRRDKVLFLDTLGTDLMGLCGKEGALSTMDLGRCRLQVSPCPQGFGRDKR